MDTFFDLRTWGDDAEYGCKVINKTSLFTSAYNGVPETLILNVLAWVLLIVLFTVLRHQAGDYGRLALVNSNGNRKRWTEVFYSRDTSVVEQTPQPHSSNNLSHTSLQQLQQQQQQNHSTVNGLDEHRGSVSSNATDSTPLSPIHYDHGLFTWILIIFKLKKEQILLHTGPDAVYYLSFQKHLILVMSIVTAVSLVIILPVNFLNGTKDEYDVNAFGRTTMANIAPESPWLWVHVLVTIIYVPLIVLIMRRSSGRNAFKKAATRTIMISNISSNDRNKTVIRNYIQELFPDVTIEDVQISYNISKLHVRNAEYERILDAKLYLEHHRDKDTLTVREKDLMQKVVIKLSYSL